MQLGLSENVGDGMAATIIIRQVGVLGRGECRCRSRRRDDLTVDLPLAAPQQYYLPVARA